MPTSARAVLEILRRSGTTKSALCASSGVSRSLLDSYLQGVSQPSVAQVERLASAAGLAVDLRLVPKRAVPPEFLAVLEFGDLFPRRDKKPLTNLGPVWRAVTSDA